MAVCYLGIGSNLGNRRQNIKSAIESIAALPQTKILQTSAIMESLAQGGPKDQPKFFNACLKIKTSLSVFALLKRIKLIEKELGRRKSLRWGPRVIDIDILFYGGKFINTRRLKIPHPRIFEREFVLKPLLEVL